MLSLIKLLFHMLYSLYIYPAAVANGTNIEFHAFINRMLALTNLMINNN